ncbi:hypothetical protein [Microbacterium sp. YY-01]|uniref:hypothetical protein n=1 Tax=Microbacterium sp. YY-01 TaxID=3421634 RepID=UPI003D165914
MSKETQPQVAVWFFVAATFVFASTSLFFPDAETWLRITTVVAGLVLVVLGGIQLSREFAQRKK